MPKEVVIRLEVLSKYFRLVGFCAHLDMLRATPAIEFKKKAIDKIIKKIKALEEE